MIPPELEDNDLALCCEGCGWTSEELDRQRCPSCGEGLVCRYSRLDERVRALAWPPRRDLPLTQRYESVLPRFAGLASGLGEGYQLLLGDDRLAREVGCGAVYLAFEGMNPTGSFKDRGTVVAMGSALARGSTAVGAVSTGNMAASVAAYARRNGVAATVMVATGVPRHKLELMRVFGPRILTVATDHGGLYFDALRAATGAGIYLMGSDDPMRIEGQKTALYDACAQLCPIEPTDVVLPVSAGGNFLAYAKARDELSGVLTRRPRLVGVQPAGCAPIADALAAGGRVEAIVSPASVAGAITNPYPPSGDRVARVARQEGDAFLAVADGAMIEAQSELASRLGIWAQVDAAAAVAGLRQLASAGGLSEDAVAICVLTGAGYRDRQTAPAGSSGEAEVSVDELAAALRPSPDPRLPADA